MRRFIPSLTSRLETLVLDGFSREKESTRDLPVGLSFRDEIENASLLVAKVGPDRSSSLSPSQPGFRQRHEVRVEERLAICDSSNRSDEIAAANLLQDIARRAGNHRAEERFIIGERSQHQTSDVGGL